MMNVLIPILFGLMTLWYLRFLWGRRKLYLHSWNTPGPFALPFIGNLYMLSTDVPVCFMVLQRLSQSCPDLMRIWFGPILLYVPSNPEYIKKISNHALERHYTYRLNEFPGVQGLISAPVEIWKRHKKVVMPSFNQNILDSFLDIFNEKADILSKQLDKHVKTKNFPLFKLTSKCTMDMICETAMGIDPNTQIRDSDEYVSSMNRLLELICIRAVNVMYHIDLIWRLSSAGRSWSEPLKLCSDFHSRVIRNKIEEQKMRNQSENIAVDSGRRLSFIDLIMKSESFTEGELNDEVGTILAAGSETSATTLEFMLMTLGLYQDIQDKVYDEVMEIMGPDRPVEPQDLSKLKYTEMALKETLRIFPTVPFVVRSVETDLRLDDKYTIPGGASVMILFLAIHRDPNYWPDPFKFDPDRFLPENKASRHAFSYLPFMGGPRNCIGGRYAMMSVMAMFVHIIRRYRFFTEYNSLEEIKLIPLITLKLKDGSKLWMERR